MRANILLAQIRPMSCSDPGFLLITWRPPIVIPTVLTIINTIWSPLRDTRRSTIHRICGDRKISQCCHRSYLCNHILIDDVDNFLQVHFIIHNSSSFPSFVICKDFFEAALMITQIALKTPVWRCWDSFGSSAPLIVSEMARILTATWLTGTRHEIILTAWIQWPKVPAQV